MATLGLLVGSYLNVVIHRLPRGQSTVFPRSGCPFCGSLIPWWDNVPVISFLWLRGRCRECQIQIRWRYPAVEILTAAIFAGSYSLFGPSFSWILAAIFGCLLVVLTLIDLEHLLLPDRITLPATALGLVTAPWLPWGGRFLDHLTGAVLGAGLLLVLYGTWYLLRRVEGLGLGDVKMMAMIGAFLGWPGVLVALLLGAMLASAVAVAGLTTRRLHLHNKMAFGPFLALGAAAAPFLTESAWLGGLLPPLPW